MSQDYILMQCFECFDQIYLQLTYSTTILNLTQMTVIESLEINHTKRIIVIGNKVNILIKFYRWLGIITCYYALRRRIDFEELVNSPYIIKNKLQG